MLYSLVLPAHLKMVKLNFLQAGIDWINNSNLLSVILIFVVVISCLYLILKIWILIEQIKKESAYLELTPPVTTEKTAYTTQQLFSVFHNLGNQRSLIDKILGRKVLYSFEIVSTKEQGIRYIIKANKDEMGIVYRNIVSYLPNVKVKQVNEYLATNLSKNKLKLIEFKLRKHYAFPLAKQNLLDEHDPVAYITGMMTKLQSNELIALQIVVSPIKLRETTILTQKILNNEDVLRKLSTSELPLLVRPITFAFILFLKLFNSVIQNALLAITELTHGSPSQQTYMYNSAVKQNQLRGDHIRPARMLSNFEQKAVESIQEKIEQALFETTIRAFIMLNDKNEIKQRVKGIKSSLAPFSVPNYQSISTKYNFPPILIDFLRAFSYKNRLLSAFTNQSSTILSISEIAGLYHFPFLQVTQTENIVKVHSKELPAPLSLKKNIDSLDITFAKNSYAGSSTMIGLSSDERRRHMYIIGATGTGKSTMIMSMVDQDIKKGKGVAVVDPHGELAEAVLSSVPEDRINDLVYFNPDDLKYSIGINLMELTPGLDEDDALREKEFIAESVISLFRKVFATSMTGSPHRIEYILRNTIHTAFTVENPTLFTIFDLLNNPVYQKKVVNNLTDENLKNFWKYEFGKAGDYQKVKMVSPVTARIGRFLFSPSAKRILEQERSTINFDEILDGKILVCNLAKGKLGEDTSQVLGIMILNKIQLAALKRARINSVSRKDFYLYVDEFQNFATKSFVEMLSESRKYKLNLIMAEQSTSQQSERDLTHIILANVGTVTTFKSANPEDEKLMLPQYTPYINQGEIANLPAYHFYMKISALNPEEPFSGETILIKPNTDKDKLIKLVEASRKNYAILYSKQSEEQKKIIMKKESTTNEKAGKSKQRTGIIGVLPEFAKS